MLRYLRKVIRITAEDSPNVRAARVKQRLGLPVDDEVVIPGVLTYAEYVQRRATWDKVRACVGLDAQFYEGAEVLLYPPDWLNRAHEIDQQLNIRGITRHAAAIGIDPAEGGDRTSMACVDRHGLIELVSRRTPDTSVITGEALGFMRRYGVPAERVVFDRGGGGKEHADRLRSQGYHVRTVAFGESLSLDPKRGLYILEARLDNKEDRYAYRNRRAEMYGTLRQLLDPANEGFGLPSGASKGSAAAIYVELRRQLAVMPLLWDSEGRMEMLPKNKRATTAAGTEDNRKTLVELIGHSPDEADALVLAIFGMVARPMRAKAGAAV